MAIHVPIAAKNSIKFAVDLLKSGNVIAVPTDTVYGLACDATNSKAVDKLYEIKKRNDQKPLAICLGDVIDVTRFAKVHHLPHGLLSSLLPGPVTLVLECAEILDKSLSCKGKIGVRVPNYTFIREVARQLEAPLALTSANLSSEPSSVNVDEFRCLWAKISGIFDGGNLTKGASTRSASTVVDLSTKGQFRIIRNGIASTKTSDILLKSGLNDKSI